MADYQGEGLCHVDLRSDGAGIAMTGLAIGSIEGKAFAARFRLLCDANWQNRSLNLETTDGRSLNLHSKAPGRWTDDADNRVPGLDGAIDLDLQASPLTNTLPIRRLGMAEADGPLELTMAYVPFDTFSPYLVRQRYTCLKGGRLYRYENADGSFSADLPVDEDGLVIDYPTLFERLPE